MNKTTSDLSVEFDLEADLPLLPAELKLLQDMLPELLKEMLWLQNAKE